MKTRLQISSIVLLLASMFAGHISFGQTTSLPTPSHVIILVEENYSYAQIIGSSYAPNINALCSDTDAAVFTQFFAIEHPSQPNYLDFFAGGNQGITSDNLPTGYPFTTPNLGAELISAGKTFVTYSEDLPTVGYDGATYTAMGANYARKHNPCTNWVYTGSGAIPANQLSPSVNQPYTAFPIAANYASLPTVSMVVPNMTNDMHDGSYPSNITFGDTWYHNHLDSLLTWVRANNALLIITYDEDDDYHGNNIPAIFFGPMVKGGTYNENVNLYNLLRTIEDMYSLGHAGQAASKSPITDVWRTHTASVNNVAGNYSIKVMPNPASDIINFRCNDVHTAQMNITVTDELGHIAGKYTMTGTELQINTSGFAQGNYIYNVECNGGVVSEGKFVIMHN